MYFARIFSVYFPYFSYVRINTVWEESKQNSGTKSVDPESWGRHACTSITPGVPYATPGAHVTLTHLTPREPEGLVGGVVEEDVGVGECDGG